MEKQKNSSIEPSRNIPKLRFPEFKEEWERKKLGDVAIFSKGKGISKADIIEDGTTECIRYGELYTHYGETIREIKSRTNIDLKDLVLSEVNDVIIPASGETQIDIATASCVLKKGVALGGDLNIIKTKNDGVFLSYYLNYRKKYEIANLAQGISVVHLYSSQLATLNLNLPALPEQARIASFFTVLDKKIAELKQKKSLLEQYKKGVMQKLFSQELRFKDENGKEFPRWEVKQVKDLFKVTRGDVLAMALVTNKIVNGNIFPVYSSQTKNKGLAGYYNEYLFEDAITWTTDGAGAGDVNFRSGKFYCTNVCGVLLNDSGYANLFIAELLNSVSRKYVSYVGNPKLMNNVMSEISIEIPHSIEEQTKIANFLSAIDDKINRTENQIQQTQQYKKGLLQNMFI
jgi:type I restriction enzyme S subunit